MSLSEAILKSVWKLMMPWSAAHPVTEGKFVALTEEVYNAAGFRGRFKKGDIVFGRTVINRKQYPVIYAVSHVGEYIVDPTMDVSWNLKLLGGYGWKELFILYASGYGENPHLTHEWYFRDTEMDIWRVNLNYYVERVVRNGKTIWDVDQELTES